ncbi:sensor histidine kinase [bacterium]|nr:sensor histidine kinase [bacterium]MBU1957864.1 sensor histidine kinase [bacterium]
MIVKIIFYTLVLFLNLLYAETALKIGTENAYKTKMYIRYTLANDLNETPTSLSKSVWKEDKSAFNTIENLDKAYWAKLKLENTTKESKVYYLQSENQFTYHIEFFMLRNGEIVNYREDGVIAKKKERMFNTNHMIFPVILKPSEEVEVYFKILNYNKIDIDFTLVTKEYLLDFYQTYNIVEGIFFGGMLLLFLYNLFLYFLLKFRVYLYYVLYTFWVTVYFVGFFGFMERYFPDYMLMFQMSSGSFFIAMTLFIQTILNLKEQLPKVHKSLNIFMGIFFLLTASYVVCLEAEIFSHAQVIFDFFLLMVPVYVVFIIISTYYLAVYKEDPIAKVYALIWTLVAFFGLLLPIVYLNLLELDFPIDYIFQFVILFEVLCFSFILAYKIKEIEKETLAQQKLLVQQNKLASMGEMISTIAHQWREPLTVINGIVLDVDVDYKESRLTEERLEEHLNNIEEVTAYLSGTIHDFMNFFNNKKTLESFYLSTVFEQSQKLVLISVKEAVLLKYGMENDIKMFGYKSELIQALLIVINNAIEAALKQNKKAQVLIHATEIESRVEITIKDNGRGIDKEMLDDLFMPYFTTKFDRKGRGLGLYILKIIIEQSMYGSVALFNGKEGAVCKIIIPKKLKMN